MFALLFITTLLPSFALASVDCSWDYESQLVTCNNHKYYDRITKKLLPITYHTSPFTRPLAEIKNDADHYSHDDKRHDNNGTASFDYFFNIGRNVNQGAATIPADCKETTGADGKTSSGPSIAYQQDENRDFKCHRIAGDVSKKENVAVGPIRDDDPTVGFYMTVKGGDDCSDSWRGNSGGYTGRSLTIRFFCDTSADAVAKLPDVETMREDLTCMYVLDVYSSHGCPLQCPRVEGFSGGKYGSTCNGPAGQCVSGAADIEPLAERNTGEPTCVCDETEGWVGPKCDKKCPRTTTGETSCVNGHCAYDSVLDAGRCFCYADYVGEHCEIAAPNAPAGTPGSTKPVPRTSGVEIFGWVLFVCGLLGLIGFAVYHKRSMGELGGSGSGTGGYGQL